MFCSKCGKTLKPDARQCEFCFEPVGESRFEGIQYTSAQRRIVPGYRPRSASQADPGEFNDARTTYRAEEPRKTFTEADKRGMRMAVESGRIDEPAAVEAPEEILEKARAKMDKLDDNLQMEEIDRSQFEIQPIESKGRAGISQDVSEYIRMLEDNAERRNSRRALRAERRQQEVQETLEEMSVHDLVDDADDELVAEPAEKPAAKPVIKPAESVAAIGDEPSEEAEPAAGEEYADEDGEYLDETIDEEYDEESFYDDDYIERRMPDLKKLLMIAAAFIVVAALFVGGFLLFRGGSQEAAPSIDGVTETLYTEGLALIRLNGGDEHVKGLMKVGTTDGIIALNTRLVSDASAIRALLPAEPSANDQLFIDALVYIQDNIGSAIIMDVSAGEASADSAAHWSVIESSISALASARTADDLTAILNGDKIMVVATPTPVPSPTPIVYTTLAKGDKTQDVLNMQSRLYELGFYNDDRDGSFGPNTQTAVKLFQEAAGLDVTGIADNATLTLLYSDEAPTANGAAPQPTVDASGN